MRSEDGGACEKGGGVGMNGGGGAIFCLRLAGGDEWLVGFSGKRGSARFTGSKCLFYVFTLCAPLCRRRGVPGASTMTKP